MSEHQPPPEPSVPPATPAAAPSAPLGDVTSEERNLALLTHILGFLTSFLGPLIIWLIKKEQSKFLDHHGKQALNFQITILIGWVIGTATVAVFIGCIILPAILIIDVIFCIIAAIAASKGEWYRYPLAIPLLR